jgi:tRNA(Arg) A34 adenosine deaminase TadA
MDGVKPKTMVDISLKNGEHVMVTMSEAMEIAEQQATHAELINIRSQKRKIGRYSIQDMKEVYAHPCPVCGEEIFHGQHHYCNYSGTKNLLDGRVGDFKDSEGYKKWSHQMRLMKVRGMKARDAHLEAWGTALPTQSWGEKNDLALGIARVCIDSNGMAFIGYDPEKYARHRMMMHTEPRSAPFAKTSEEPKKKGWWDKDE